MMEALCYDMLSLVCSELSLPADYVSQLKENEADGGNGVVSMSNLTFFKYGREGEVSGFSNWLNRLKICSADV